MSRVGLSPSWITYYNELDMLFSEDKDVKVIYDDEAKKVNLYVNSGKKAYALSELLKNEVNFGNVKLKISILSPNHVEVDDESLYEEAFNGNKAFSYMVRSEGIFEVTYVVFANKVVQYFNDNMSDVNGNCSTLYEHIARKVIKPEHSVFFCTDVPGVFMGTSSGKPVRDWT